MRLNARLAKEQPLCAHCLKDHRFVPGTETDHIVPLHRGGTDQPSNLQRLCRDCHEAKTRTDMGYSTKAKVTIGVDGWPLVK